MAVVFLGTPHRGSPGLAKLGDSARRVASVMLRMDSNATILESLGLKNSALEIGHESFVALWDEYGFHVKTFQESYALTGVNVGLLNELVVSKESSTIGNPREHSETLEADHVNMTKFKSVDDQRYKQVGGELKEIINDVKLGHIPTLNRKPQPAGESE